MFDSVLHTKNYDDLYGVSTRVVKIRYPRDTIRIAILESRYEAYRDTYLNTQVAIRYAGHVSRCIVTTLVSSLNVELAALSFRNFEHRGVVFADESSSFSGRRTCRETRLRHGSAFQTTPRRCCSLRKASNDSFPSVQHSHFRCRTVPPLEPDDQRLQTLTHRCPWKTS